MGTPVTVARPSVLNILLLTCTCSKRFILGLQSPLHHMINIAHGSQSLSFSSSLSSSSMTLLATKRLLYIQTAFSKTPKSSSSSLKLKRMPLASLTHLYPLNHMVLALHLCTASVPPHNCESGHMVACKECMQLLVALQMHSPSSISFLVPPTPLFSHFASVTYSRKCLNLV